MERRRGRRHMMAYQEGGRGRMCRGGGRCFIGMFAISMGAGILIAAIFPTGLLMFLIASLLLASGFACFRR